MLKLNVEKIGKMAIIHCEGRIVRSDAAFRLRDAVQQQSDARIVVLDLSDVGAMEGGGVGMLVFLHVWTRDHGIQLKVFDPPDSVRRSLGRTRSAATLEIAGVGEVLSLLGWKPEEMWNGVGRAA
jgi:anti-anti-sigma factor